MDIYKTAVIGAGAMGAEIAQTISSAGLPVIIRDINPEALERGIKAIRKIYQSQVSKGRMVASEVETKMALVTGTTSYDTLKDVDLVIEAVSENSEVKKQVFKELDRFCPAGTILASNTSALPISELGKVTKRPDKVIGMHFFFPAHVMKLVEIIPGLGTPSGTIDTVMRFTKRLNKIPVRVNECAGFLVNRLFMPYLNEAIYCLQENAATLEEIDQTMVNFGFPMGPFTLVDMLGLDICAEVLEILADSYGDRMKPAKIWNVMHKNGFYGQKRSVGFYIYDNNRKEPVSINPALEKMIMQLQKETNIKRTRFSLERLVMPMINEAVICLEEGISEKDDIDTAMLIGLAFPQDKGGVLHYADSLGIDFVLTTLENLHKEFGRRFCPAPRLKEMVTAGYLGKKSGKGFFEYRV